MTGSSPCDVWRWPRYDPLPELGLRSLIRGKRNREGRLSRLPEKKPILDSTTHDSRAVFPWSRQIYPAQRIYSQQTHNPTQHLVNYWVGFIEVCVNQNYRSYREFNENSSVLQIIKSISAGCGEGTLKLSYQ